MTDAFSRAREFALERHADQQYAGRPYAYHLERVAQVLTRFGYEGPAYQMAAWLHDVVEDTPTTIDEVRDLFGRSVSDLVWSVTGIGPNRKTRNADIYRKLGEYVFGIPLKVADRIVNHDASIFDPVKGCPSFGHAQMYFREGPEFRDVVLPHLRADMAAVLNHQYYQLESIVNGLLTTPSTHPKEP